ncbi:CBS domain-containing protein [Streptomyces sp. NPDC048243]|uniref:CBS domain-containing protein n=1 Tax=Streptomyces sp. NPDC048243 TaxID=3365522 RepID=UPI00371A25A4
MRGTPLTVGDVMTHTVAAVDKQTGFKEVARLMQHRHVSAVPVTAATGHVVGVISQVDLLSKEEVRDDPDVAFLQLRQPVDMAKAGAVTAADLMSSPAVTVHAHATLAEASRVMMREGVKHLPVVDVTGRLKGIASRSDLLKVFLRDDEDIAAEVRREVLPSVFSQPSSAIRVDVWDGVVTLTGRVHDTALIPVTARLVRTVEGVVDVHIDVPRERGGTGESGRA